MGKVSRQNLIKFKLRETIFLALQLLLSIIQIFREEPLSLFYGTEVWWVQGFSDAWNTHTKFCFIGPFLYLQLLDDYLQ